MRQICTLLKMFVFAFMVLLVITVAVGVIFRYVLQNTLSWATEFPTLLFVWIVFFGAVIAFHEGKHIGFTVLLERLPTKVRGSTEILALILLCGFFLFLTVAGFSVVITNWESETEAMRLSYGLVYSCVPISSILMLLESLGAMINKLKKGN